MNIYILLIKSVVFLCRFLSRNYTENPGWGVALGWAVGALEGAFTGKLAASALAAMNPLYHPYAAPELTSPHPPSPDSNYHGHPGTGGSHLHPQMHRVSSNGHGIGPLGWFKFFLNQVTSFYMLFYFLYTADVETRESIVFMLK